MTLIEIHIFVSYTVKERYILHTRGAIIRNAIDSGTKVPISMENAHL
jgi:hypothetical protein